MGFVTKRFDATRSEAVPRIKRWIATPGSQVARIRQKRSLLKLRLIAKANDADRGRTVNTRGLSDDQFLALLRR